MPGRRPGSGFLLHSVGPAPDPTGCPYADAKNEQEGDEIKADLEEPENGQVPEAVHEQRFRNVETPVRERHGVAQKHGGGCVFAPEVRGLRQGVDQYRHRKHDPEQDRNVAEPLYVDGHQAGDDPVARQPENPDENADHRGQCAPHDREEQRVEEADDGCPEMGRARCVFDQPLVDVIAGGLAQETETHPLAEGVQVLDGVADQPGNQQHEAHDGDNLNRHRPVPGVVEQHARGEGALRGYPVSHSRASGRLTRKKEAAASPCGGFPKSSLHWAIKRGADPAPRRDFGSTERR